jgi:hypothetical protein
MAADALAGGMDTTANTGRVLRTVPAYLDQREGEYKYCRGPTFGDFVTIRTEASMQDVTIARL